MAAVLLANLDEIDEDLIVGALVVLGEQRIRITEAVRLMNSAQPQEA